MARPPRLPRPTDRRQGARLLVAWQVARGYTQAQAAEVIGIAQSTYSDWCSGALVPSERRRPSIAERTGGAVPVGSWSLEEPQLAAAGQLQTQP